MTREHQLSSFSPRDVQARVRAGESAQDVADDTGWPLDKVLRYAEPLLQERAYIAEQAQAVEVRRTGGTVSLLESALKALGAGGQGLAWDAHRREDGRWIVSAAFGAGDKARTAQWTYDPAGRNLHALDDQARALMGVAHEALTPAAVEVISDALDLAREEPEPPRPRLVAVPDPQTAILERSSREAGRELEDQADDQPDERAVLHSDGAPGHPTGTETTIMMRETVVIEEIITVGEMDGEPSEGAPAGPVPRTPTPKAKGRRGRAAMPTWDEILFGTTRPED